MRSIILALLMVLSIVGGVSAQDVTGNLQGRVLSTDGLPIEDVQITIAGGALQGVRIVSSDSRGYFRIHNLPVGSYSLRLQRIGYRELAIEDVRILLGATVTLGELRLEIQPVELSPLVVEARPMLIDPASTTLGANLEASTIETLPVDRNYRSTIAVLPHANESFYGDEVNIGGSTGLENLYYIDGVNITTPWDASTGMNLPYNFIKEIQIKEGGYEAEYGRALGGIVNVITHSGSNEWEGNAFGYATNSALTADKRSGPLDLPEGDFATYDLGLRLSGPIVRDRLWLSAAYNPAFANREVQALNQGFFEDRRTVHRFAAKVTWRAGEHTDVEASVIGDPTTHHHVAPPTASQTILQLENPDPFLWLTEEGGLALVLRGQQTVGRRLVLEGTVSRFEGNENKRGDTDVARSESYYHDYLTKTTEGGYFSRRDLRSVRTSANVSGTFFLGPHSVKVGVSYEENRVDFSLKSNGIGSIAKNDTSRFVMFTSSNELQARRNRIPTVYVQDSWRLADRLTVNAGLRWDGQYLYGAGDSVAQAFTKDWQPRVGFTFQPGELGSQKLFGSYGRFYQQRPLLSSVYFLSGFRTVQSAFSADPRDPGVEPDYVFEWIDLAQKVEGVDGEHFDEFTLGYERVVGRNLRLVARGIHRVLRESYLAGFDSLLNFVVGNPGEGDLSHLTDPERQYTALELTAEHGGSSPVYFLTSYVLSRSYGNYPGLFSSDTRRATPGANDIFQCADQGRNSAGLLPNDRTHVLKLAGSYRSSSGISAATFFTWQSGTPLNEFGPGDCMGVAHPVFLVQRGSAGRMPSIWDLNARFTYSVPWRGVTSRLVLDILHIGSPREVTVVDQLRLLGGQAPNPTFGEQLVFQPPMTVRLGLEVNF